MRERLGKSLSKKQENCYDYVVFYHLYLIIIIFVGGLKLYVYHEKYEILMRDEREKGVKHILTYFWFLKGLLQFFQNKISKNSHIDLNFTVTASLPSSFFAKITL